MGNVITTGCHVENKTFFDSSLNKVEEDAVEEKEYLNFKRELDKLGVEYTDRGYAVRVDLIPDVEVKKEKGKK